MDSTVPESPSIRRGHAPAGHRWGIASIFVVLAACAFLSLTAPPDLADTAGGFGLMVGFGAAGTTAVSKARRMTGRDRLSWMLVGSGLLVAAVGVTVVALIQIVGGPVPAFGPTDLFFIITYALILAGFGSLPHLTTSWAARTRVYLDSLIGALSLGAIMWVVVLDDLITEFAQASAWDRWAGSAYPVLDVRGLDGGGHRYRPSEQLPLRPPPVALCSWDHGPVGGRPDLPEFRGREVV